VIAWTGGITALLAALMAVQQNDIKRILAYSTLSQLGYMVMAVGLRRPGGGMYHLVTHAFFKALLFLGAGSVIHALHHEQDIWKMGGLKIPMPVTFWTFLVGTLALCGVPPFSGFYSKDSILAAAESRPVLFGPGRRWSLLLTTFYMFRLVFVALRENPRAMPADHAHESPSVMLWPLRFFLPSPRCLAGFWGIDTRLQRGLGMAGASGHEDHGDFLAGALRAVRPCAAGGVPGSGATGSALPSPGPSTGTPARDPLPGEAGGALARWMRDRFYFDEDLLRGLIRSPTTPSQAWPTGSIAGSSPACWCAACMVRRTSSAALCAWCRPATSRPTPFWPRGGSGGRSVDRGL
jgi:hypothetical protein